MTGCSSPAIRDLVDHLNRFRVSLLTFRGYYCVLALSVFRFRVRPPSAIAVWAHQSNSGDHLVGSPPLVGSPLCSGSIRHICASAGVPEHRHRRFPSRRRRTPPSSQLKSGRCPRGIQSGSWPTSQSKWLGYGSVRKVSVSIKIAEINKNFANS
jgi:hypothetical protein